MDETGGTLTPVMVNDVELTSNLSCRALLEEADSVGQPWSMMMVSTLSIAGGAVPGSDEAKAHLKKMAGDVLQGRDLAAYAIFDRDGTRLVVNPAPPPDFSIVLRVFCRGAYRRLIPLGKIDSRIPESTLFKREQLPE